MKKDLTALYLGFAARYLTSFAALPFLSRVLSPSGLGNLVMATSLATTIALWVEFGFNISALRDLAEARDQNERGNVLACVSLAKLLLASVSAVLLISCGSEFANLLGAGAVSLWMVAALGVLQGFNLSWYFQGVGRAPTGAAIDAATQLAWVVAALCFVRSAHDVSIVIGCQLSSQVIAVLATHSCTLRRNAMLVPKPRQTLSQLKAGFPMFVMRVGVAAYTTASVLIVGKIAGAAQAGYYNAAERFIGTTIAAFGPAAQALMPLLVRRRMSDGDEAMLRSAKTLLGVLLGLSVIGALSLSAGAGVIITIFTGKAFQPSIHVLRILSLTLPAVAVSQVLGLYVLTSLRMDKFVSLGILCGGVVSIVSASAFAAKWGAAGMAVSRVLAESTIALTFALVLLQKGLLNRLIGPSGTAFVKSEMQPEAICK